MKKHFFKICSMLLVIVLLINMLPMSILAEELQGNITNSETTPADPPSNEIISEDTYVVSEITENRTEFSKEFLLSNGLHMAMVYADAVHYETESGWEEIDNTLKTNQDGTYSNTAGAWDVTFPEQLDKDESIVIAKDGYTLSFFMSGELTAGSAMVMSADAQAQTFGVTDAQAATGEVQQMDTSAMEQTADFPETVPDKLQSQITYADVYENTDVIYDLDSNKVKESMILESYNADLRGYSYTLEVGTMIPVLGEDGSVTLYDKDRKNIVMVMPAPYLIDNNNVHNYDIEVQLIGSGSTYTLIYLLPQEWLAAEDRAWPVVLDPWIQTDLSADNIRDRTVAEKRTYDQDQGTNLCGWDSDTGILRSYIKYAELPVITSSDVVLRAEMHMYKAYASGTKTTVEAHKVLGDGSWDSSTITWANQPAFDETVEDFAVVKAEKWYSWIVTDIVRGWYSGANTGMLFKADNTVEAGGKASYKTFLSSDFGTKGSRPVLFIYFRNNNGLEGYWDYTSSTAGRAGAGYINNYTGNLTWIRNDIGFGGNRMPVTIQHVYNLNDAVTPNDTTNTNDSSGNSFGMGIGWRTNFNQLVYKWKVSGADKGYYVWEDGDGTDHYFELKDGVYKDEDGLELTLTVNNSGTEKYCITDKNGNCSYFDTQGRLVRLSNNQEVKSNITITYTNSTDKFISTVTDGVGRVYSFTYNDSNLLTKISYMGSGSTELSYVTFTYDGEKLQHITDKDGETSTYTYSGSLLKTATDIDGYVLTYDYNTIAHNWQPYRVQGVSEKDGNALGGSLSFTYGHNETVIADYNGNTETYQFNDFGNTVSIQDDEGRAQFTQFARMNKDDTAGKANQMTVASKLQSTVVNLAACSSFEHDETWEVSSAGGSCQNVTTEAYIGTHSLLLNATEQASLVSESFVIEPGATYTFSAYVKGASGESALILADQNSTILQQVTATVGETPWQRVEISYTNTTDANITVSAQLSGAAGTQVYLDCVQIEKAASASRYNLVENGDFRNGTNAWTDGTGSVAQCTAPSPNMDGNAYKIVGSPTEAKTVTQRIEVSGKSGDSFVLAGWAKADSAPIKDDRKFGIQVKFNGTAEEDKEIYLDFNPDVDNWQYAAVAVVAPADYTYITLEITYNYNANTAYFDGIQLYKEEFGSSFTYDEDGNVISVKDLQAKNTEYEYDDNNNLTEIIQDGKTKMTYEYYEDSHNVKTATTEEGLKYDFTYDDYGNNTKVSITSGDLTMCSTAAYTADGNYLHYSKDALDKQTTYCYNPDTGVLEWVQYPEDTETTRTTYTYDSMYRMATAACTTDTGLQLNASYVYTDDLLTSITTPSTTYSFSYGDFSLRTGVSIGNRTLATYHYTEETVDDRKYDLDRLDYGNGDNVQYEYDDKGRITKQTYEDNSYIAYFYDGDGAVAKVYDSQTGITTAYTYDLTGRLVKYAEVGEGHDYSLSYSYNDENQLSTVTEILNGHDRTSTYQYDDDGRITFFEKVLARRRYTYDAFGRVSSAETLGRDYAQIFNTTYSYNDTAASVSSQVSSMTHDGPQYDVTYSYTYDDNGNILSVSSGGKTTTYIYDSANQLIRENNQSGSFTYTWTYDNAGNILSRKEYAYTTGSLEGVTPTDTVTYTYGDSGWGDLLTAYDGNTITYDQIGNPLTDGEWTYTWQHGRQLASMSKTDKTWTYTYNADGLRVGRTDGTTNYRYVYDGDKLTFMARNGLYLRFAYTPEGTPLSVLYKGTTYYYVTNLQGDVTAILSQSGYVMVEYTYDAWGNVLTVTGPLKDSLGIYNPLRYRGYVYDQETLIYYLQSRFYDPEIGRFINGDTLFATGQGIRGNNNFTYCLSNPICMADHDGFDAIYIVTYSFRNGGLPIVGHASVLVQNAAGDWISTEYGSSDWNPANAKISTGGASDSYLEEVFNGSTTFDTVYIEGDFTASAELAFSYNNSDYGGYNLVANNCNHYAIEILRAGEPSGRLTAKTLCGRLSIVPTESLKALQRSIHLDRKALSLQNSLAHFRSETRAFLGKARSFVEHLFLQMGYVHKGN